MSSQTQIAVNQGFQIGWKLPSLIILPELRRKVTLQPPTDDRYEKRAEAATIVIERFPDTKAKPSADHLPYYSLEIAASGFRQGYEPDPEGWVNVRKLGCTKRIGDGFFVTQVAGKSMEPTIRDGSYCVFRAGVSGTRQNRILLVQKRDFTDPETGGGYTIKRYESTKSKSEDGWRHERIRLIPDNPDRAKFPVLEFSAQDDTDLEVVAEFVQTLVLPD
jgi:phage repressor protein C with HTH and peptisase S24 domain